MEELLKITRSKIFFLRKKIFSKILLPLFCSAYYIKLLFETFFSVSCSLKVIREKVEVAI